MRSALQRIVWWMGVLGLGLSTGPLCAQQMAPAEARADVEVLLETFASVHPDLYHTTSRTALRQRNAVLKRQLETPISARALYVALARMAASFEDGHTRVDLPLDAYEAAARSGTRTFPFTVAPRGSALQVQRACSTAPIPPRSRITSINGRDARVLFQTVAAVVAGTETYREAVAGDRFPWLLWAHEVEAPFRITYQRPGTAQPETTTLPGIDFARVRQCLAPDPAPPFTYQRRANVGLLTLNRMTQPHRFRQFLATVSDRIAAHPVDGLVLDLRPCQGGRTHVARLLLGALTDGPLRLVARKDWKVSPEYKVHLRGRVDPSYPYLEQRNGRVVSIEYDPEPLPDVPLRYRGPVTVLVGPRTFSSAVTLAATLKAHDLATVVGEETGGRVHRFGEGYTFRLPNSGLRAMVSSAYFVHASRPHDRSGGLTPDIHAVSPVGVGSDLPLGRALVHLRRTSR